MFRAIRNWQILLVSVLCILLVSQPAQAAQWPEYLGGPDYLGGKNVTIRIHYTATAADRAGDWTKWPAVGVFLNNMNTYDGPMDYGTCEPGKQTAPNHYCGTAPLYEDRMIDKYPVEGSTFVKDTVVPATELFHFFAYGDKQYYDLAKLSIVFYNDYWNPGQNQDRNLAVTRVQFIGPDGAIFKDFTPRQYESYYGTNNIAHKQSFYFDMGIVTFDDPTVPTKMIAAFDKKEIQTVVENKSKENGEWRLHQEGSFNLVSEDLYEAFAAKYINIKDEPNYSCGMDMTVTCGDAGTATVTYSFSQQPNFRYDFVQARLNAHPAKKDECKNESGLPQDWFCGLTEGRGLDQMAQIKIGTYTKVFTVSPGVPYQIRTSVDHTSDGTRVNDGGTDISKLSLKCSSPAKEFTCQVKRKGPADVNVDGIISTKDHDMLVQVFADRLAAGYLSADVDLDGYVSIFDYTRVLEALKDSE